MLSAILAEGEGEVVASKADRQGKVQGLLGRTGQGSDYLSAALWEEVDQDLSQEAQDWFENPFLGLVRIFWIWEWFFHHFDRGRFDHWLLGLLLLGRTLGRPCRVRPFAVGANCGLCVTFCDVVGTCTFWAAWSGALALRG